MVPVQFVLSYGDQLFDDENFPSIFPGSARRGAIIYVRKKLQAVEVDIDTESQPVFVLMLYYRVLSRDATHSNCIQLLFTKIKKK
jgi:hypothetical protein